MIRLVFLTLVAATALSLMACSSASKAQPTPDYQNAPSAPAAEKGHARDSTPVATKAVPVKARLVGTVGSGYSLSESKVSPEAVGISGPASLVNLVDAVVADVNVTGLKLSLEREYTLTARDAQGGDIDGVNLDQNTAKVSLTIVKQEFTLVYIVSPSVTGNVAPGYRVSAVEANPAFVSVSGPLEVLQSIDVLTTENIAVDGAQSDVVRSVRLRLPQGAHVAGDVEVEVRVRVAPAP